MIKFNCSLFRKQSLQFIALFFLFLCNNVSAQYARLAIQDFDTIQTPSLGYVLSSGTLTFVNGNSPATSASPASSPFGIGGSWTWYQQGQSGGVMLTFNNVGIVGYDTAYVTFRLAAFALNDGVDAADYVTAAVSINNGTNWYDQIKVTGASGGNSSWAYTASGSATRVFSTAAVTTFAPAASGLAPDGITTVTIKVPNTTGQVRVRITERSSTTAERWCIDNVEIKVRSSVVNNASVTALVSPVNFCPGFQDVKVRIANRGSNIINNVNVNWQLNGVTQTPVFWSSPMDTVGGVGRNDTVVTLTNMNFSSFSTNTFKVWTSAPNFLTDSFNADDTINIVVRPSLNGTYTIGGTTPNYVTIAAAVSDLTTYGVCGPVTFVVAPGTYSGQVNIGNIAGTSSVNTILFDGVSSSTRIITAAQASGAALLLNGSRYVTFRNFTITNTTAGSCTGAAIVSNTNGTGANCSIKNCVISLPSAYGFTSYGVLVTGNANGYTTASSFGDSLTIDSNTITGAYYGIFVYGSTSASSLYNRDNKIRYNTINNSYYMGIYTLYQYNGVVISNNTINMDPAGDPASFGIYFETSINNAGTVSQYISGNKIKDAGAYGMYLYNIGGGASNPTKIYNNMIGGGFRDNTGNGVYLYSTNYIEFFHNSILHDVASLYNYAGAFTLDGTGNAVIKNNIFACTSTTGMGLPAYFYVSPAALNSNLYYRAGGSELLYRNALTYNSTNFKTATAGGDSSYNTNPSFVSNSNLHIANGCLRGADLLASVPVDIDGDIRTSPPLIGADEFLMMSNNLAIDGIVRPTVPISTGTQDLVVRVRNLGNNAISFFTITYRNNLGTPVSQTWSGSLNTCDTVSVTFTGSNQITLGASNNILVYTSGPNATTDSDPGNDTLRSSYYTPLNGSYTIGATASDFPSFNAAVGVLNSAGIAGPVIFNVRTGTYNEILNITSVSGTSTINTVTFISMANHRDSVVLGYNPSATTSLIRLINANYINFKSMSVTSASASFGMAVELVGTSSYDTIDNCKLTAVEAGVYGDQFTGAKNVIRNNLIMNGSFGVYLMGVSTASMSDSMIIENNVFQNTTSYGAYLYYIRNVKFRNNTITGTSYGMYTRYCYDATEVTRNRINVTGYGMYMYFTYGTASAYALIANNQVIGGTYGIRNFSSYYQQVYNNSISANSANSAVYLSYASATYLNNEWKNNVIVNNGTGVAGNIASSAPSNVFDYNLYYTAGATLLTSYATLPLWRTATGFDMNSVSYRPGLTGTTNMQPNITDTASWILNGRGVQNTIITNDINNNPRSNTLAGGAPDIGAYEFTPTALPPVTVAVPATPASGTTQSFLLAGDTVAKIAWSSLASAPTAITVRLYSGANPPSVNPATDKYMTTYWDVSATAGSYLYDISLFYKDAWLGTNATDSNVIGAMKVGTNPWSNYPSPSSAINTSTNILSITSLNDLAIYTGTDNANPLPVNMVDFTAFKNSSNVVLNWMTSSEINSESFVVERSSNGITFSKIGEVKASGNANDIRNYSYDDIDALVSGRSVVLYYRLKMEDNDGRFACSKTVSVNNNQTDYAVVILYPNPVKNELHIVSANAIIKDSKISIIDITGKVFYTGKVNTGDNISIDTYNMNSGIYFYILESGSGESIRGKFVKE